MGLKFRRGTTAQKSGSLAFGEPYVNTTLGTLQIGLDTGDVTLSALGTGSNIAVAGISGSSLDITGNAKIDGNLTLGGNITIGDSTTDNVVINADLSSSLIPNDDNAFDIGSTSKRYRNIYAQNISSSLLTNVTGSNDKLAYFSENNKVTSYANSFIGSQTFGLGTSATSSGAPERLMVDNSGLSSYNIATFQTSQQNQYAQVNIKNFGSGSNASTDLVLWNDATTENTSYVDLGINSSNYSAGNVGYNSDGYLYTNANDLYIGAAATGSHGHLHLFAGNLWSSSSITVYSDGTVGVNTEKLNTSASSIPTPGFAMEISGGVKFDNSIEVTGSVRATSFVGSIGATNGVVSGSSQVVSILSSLNTYTSSNDTTNTSQNNRLSRLEESTASVNSFTSSYARTNIANVFTANQIITGSLFITQDLVVQGSSSIQTISSSRLDIGDNIIQLNVNNPVLRFGGLAIFDSGSAGGSGSFLYDSVEDEFIFVHRGNGVNVTSSHFVMGPETYDNVGNETYLTNNRLPKGTGKEHLNDSNITDTGTLITLGSNTVVAGTIVASGTSLVSASAQISHDSTTGYSANRHVDHTTVSITAGSGLSGGGDISATRTLSIATGGVTDAMLAGSISNAKLTNSSITIAGQPTSLGSSVTAETIRTAIGTVVTGSSQITGIANSQLTNNSITIAGVSTALGSSITAATIAGAIPSATITNAQLVNSTISGIALGSNLATLTIGTGLSGTSYNGSGAVTIANTGVTSNVAGTGVTVSGATGAVTISIGQAVATSSNVQFNSLGIGMAASATAGRIDATNDIVAYSSSDVRFKENIKPIENPLEKISKISGNTYDWKAENKIEHGYEGNDVGVIAQEIEAVLPQLVQTRESGYKAVKYDKLVALLIEGIKEQQTQIHNLTLEVEKLKESKGL